MSVLKAIGMGVLQGLTEFLPVSSSGHLAIFKCIFKMDTETGVLFDVLLHVATLIAICIVYYRDLVRLILEFCGMIKDIFENLITFFKGRGSLDEKPYRQVISNPFRRFVLMIIISTIPTGILGYLLKDVVEFAGSNLLIPGICLICTGIIIMFSDFLQIGAKKMKDANYGDAFGVGVAQGIATLPGLSRSGTTIAACLLCGFDRKFAAKYSFIMSIPAILGALVLELSDIKNETITSGDVGCYLIGMLVAAVVGLFALKFAMSIVVNKKFKYFAYYCLTVGAICLIAFIVML